MKTKFSLTLAAIALLAVMAVSVQAAQVFRVNVPFQFIVKERVLPAGQYDFMPNDNDQAIEIIPVTKGGSPAVTTVVTRLCGEIHTTPKDSHIVFDKIGDTYFLSELWTAGNDGYLLRVTKEKHQHRSITVPS